MLRTLTIVTGLPDSGKTTWCRSQQARLPFLELVDDPSVDIAQWGNITVDTEHALVSDPRFCAMDLERSETH